MPPAPTNGAKRALLRVMVPVIPTLGFVYLVSTTLWGDEGLLALHAERQEAAALGARLALVQRETTMLQWRLHRLKHEPLALEREIAAERGMARAGTVIHVLDPAAAPVGGGNVPAPVIMAPERPSWPGRLPAPAAPAEAGKPAAPPAR